MYMGCKYSVFDGKCINHTYMHIGFNHTVAIFHYISEVFSIIYVYLTFDIQLHKFLCNNLKNYYFQLCTVQLQWLK